MEKGGLRSALQDGVVACLARSNELGNILADTSKLIRYFEASGSGEEARRMLDLAEQV